MARSRPKRARPRRKQGDFSKLSKISDTKAAVLSKRPEKASSVEEKRRREAVERNSKRRTQATYGFLAELSSSVKANDEVKPSSTSTSSKAETGKKKPPRFNFKRKNNKPKPASTERSSNPASDSKGSQKGKRWLSKLGHSPKSSLTSEQSPTSRSVELPPKPTGQPSAQKSKPKNKAAALASRVTGKLKHAVKRAKENKAPAESTDGRAVMPVFAPYYPKPKALHSVFQTLQANSKVGEQASEIPFAYTELLLRQHADSKAVLEDLAAISQLSLAICGLIALPYSGVKWMFDGLYEWSKDTHSLIIQALTAPIIIPMALAKSALYMSTQLFTYVVDVFLKEALYLVDHYLQGMWRNTLHGSVALYDGFSNKRILSPVGYNTTQAFAKAGVSEPSKVSGSFVTLFAENNRALAKRSIQLPTKLSEVKLSSLLLQIDRMLHVVLTLPYAVTSMLQHKSRDYQEDTRNLARHAFYGAATGMNFCFGLLTELASLAIDTLVFSHLVSVVSFVEDRLMGQENNVVNHHPDVSLKA